MSVKGGKGEQLKMFDTAKNLVGDLLTGRLASHETDLYSGEDGPLTPKQEASANLSMMRDKLRESKEPFEEGGHGSGVYDSIELNGFKGHVTLDQSRDKPALWEGHHRLAAAGSMDGDQWVGLNHVVPQGGGAARKIDDDYATMYPQNVGDLEWARATDSKKIATRFL
jgi:hypothetical protein